jgi:hypothetical protein
MMEETLQICERAQRSTQDASHRMTFSFGLWPPSDVYTRQAMKSIQIQSGRQQPSSDLKVESRARRAPLDVPCIYHKGAWHTLRVCRLQKKIDQERDVSRATQAPTSPDGSEFQKAWIRISPTARDPLGGASYWSQRTTRVGRRDGFRGGASDPSQREPHLEAGGGAAPGGTPVCPRPMSRVRRGRAPDVQQPAGQPGCGVGTSPAGQSFARGRSYHGLRPGRHCSGRGE